MTYHQAFNRLGETVQPQQPRPSTIRMHHRIQAAAWTVATVCAAALIWIR